MPTARLYRLINDTDAGRAAIFFHHAKEAENYKRACHVRVDPLTRCFGKEAEGRKEEESSVRNSGHR